MEKILLAFTLVFFVSLAHSQVSYDIKADSEEVEVDTTIILDCSDSSTCPVNSWNLQWKVPQNAEITELSDSQGSIDNFDRTKNNIRIETNTGPKRRMERLKISYVSDSGSERLAEGLYRHRVDLSAFPDRKTSGSLEVENLLSGRISDGFESSYSDDSVSFRGDGPGEILVNFGEGESSQYYTFFNGRRNASLAYRVSVGTTGLRQSYRTITVVLLDESSYESSVSPWSQGEYAAGLVKLRKNLGEDFQPVLAEETVHAFNGKALDFDRTSSTWLDEGIGSYTQSMVRRKLQGSGKMRQIFGDEISYLIRRNGSRYRVTKPSTGNREDLWNYFTEDQSFMKKWNPRKVDRDIRSFGYAYSELIIRNYVSQGNRVSDLYSKIDTNRTLQNNQEKWQYMGQYMDLTPCKFESRQRFDQCLERINSYDYKVYSAKEIPEVKTDPIEVEELETPNYTVQKSKNYSSSKEVNNLISQASQILQELIFTISKMVYN